MAHLEQRQAELAAAEAAKIGGSPGNDLTDADGNPLDESERPLAEAGEGEAEGRELAEAELIENASHGDQHAARRVLADAPEQVEDDAADRHEYDTEADTENP